MAYCTNFQFIQDSGLGTKVVDEVVGVGDGVEADYDLDNDRIVSGSYTLSHAPAGSNTFTDLTDVTDYSLDLDSGRIILTASGISAVGTDTIYANYYFATEQITDDMITRYIASADAEIDLLTNRNWGAPVDTVEYRDGRRRSLYPTTDRPFQQDYDAADEIVLRRQPLYQLKFVYFLSHPLNVSKAFNYDDSGASFTDVTSQSNDSQSALYTPFATPPDVSDLFYVGLSHRFLGLNMVLATLGTGSPSIVWEFWAGSSWAALTTTDDTAGASNLTASGIFTWAYPYGWEKTSVNGQSLFWVRGRVSTGYTVAPQIASVVVQDPIAKFIEPRQIRTIDSGVIKIIDSLIPNGECNLRFDYSYGLDATPPYITELSCLISANKGFLEVSGSSFDQETGLTLGTKSIQVGEAWVNVKNVIEENRKKIKDILDNIGVRADSIAI